MSQEIQAVTMWHCVRGGDTRRVDNENWPPYNLGLKNPTFRELALRQNQESESRNYDLFVVYVQ